MCEENKAVEPRTPKYESEQLNELATALAKAQGEMKFAKKDCANTFFKSKYADMAEVVDAARAALSKNGLSVVQRVITGNRGMMLCTRLMHLSGQWMESTMPIQPIKQDIQSIGSYITYLRRYMFSAITGVVPSDFIDDDDGNEAMPFVGGAQLKSLKDLFEKLSADARAKALSEAKIDNLDRITQNQFNPFKNFILAQLKGVANARNN